MTDQPASNRLLSIDIFRGLTILMMIFVNDLAGVKHIPDWMKHAGAYDDTMTFVDVVFPAFLFIVGMAIPFSIRARINKGESLGKILKHTFIRTFGLLVLGIFMVNSAEMNKEATLIPSWSWKVVLYTSAILIWNKYPKVEGTKKYFFLSLRLLGVIALICLIPLFRKGEDGELWMTTSWWGILGLIGWAYLISTIVYLIFKQNLSALIATIGIFVLLDLGLRNEGLALYPIFNFLKAQTGNISHSILCLSGMVISVMLMAKSKTEGPLKCIQWMLIAGIFLATGGFFTRPFFGISKILATPSWALYCAAICSWLFAIIYWILDIKRFDKWINFLLPAGINPLLTYILPPILYALLGYAYAPELFNSGALGIIRALLFSILVLGITGIMTKWKIRLHL